MDNTYIDFHIHTTQSDGAYTPSEVCRMVNDAGIGILSITDHNYTEDLTELRKEFADLLIVQGAEISCIHTNSVGKKTELHIVGLGFDIDNSKIKKVFAHNQPSRQPYINAILDKLRLCGIELGNYNDLCNAYPNHRQIGRMNIAKTMTERGYVNNIERAFDEYIGAHGKRRAYFPNPLQYVPMEEAITAIIEAGGVAVLAHLNYYCLSDSENNELLHDFKVHSGENGAMEVYYSRYNQMERMQLKTLADKYNLMYSAASDFHGQNENETLVNNFKVSDCSALLKILGVN